MERATFNAEGQKSEMFEARNLGGRSCHAFGRYYNFEVTGLLTSSKVIESGSPPHTISSQVGRVYELKSGLGRQYSDSHRMSTDALCDAVIIRGTSANIRRFSAVGSE